MPSRKQPARQSQVGTSAAIDLELVAKRTRRHLDELERSNYVESAGIFEDDDEGTTAGGRTAKSRAAARQIISDKKDWGDGSKKKKSTMNVRTALLYRKNLATLAEESRIASLPSNVPTYLTVVSPPPSEPPRMLCAICGYWGRYKCEKCAMPYCDMNCEGIHNETRCEKRVV